MTQAPTESNEDALSLIELFPQDEDWSLQTMRLLAQVAVGGADLFECARTAARIGETTTDGEVWQREWSRTAQEVAAQGEAALERGDVTTPAALCSARAATTATRSSSSAPRPAPGRGVQHRARRTSGRPPPSRMA